TKGAVVSRTGGAENAPRPFGTTLAEKSITPFPLPAHRTGRAAFPHPALGRDSRQSMRGNDVTKCGYVSGDRTPSFPKVSSMAHCRQPAPATLCGRRRK